MNIFNFKPLINKKFEFNTEVSPERIKPERTPSVSHSCDENLKILKEYFTTEKNTDIKIREFHTGGGKAFIFFVENLVDSEILNNDILAPLMLLKNNNLTFDKIYNTLLVHNQVDISSDFEKILESINMGDCALFIDGIAKCIVIDVKSWSRRGIEPPVSESVIYGPHEGFNENYKTNIALIRKNIRNENMICETVYVGNISKTPLSILYMKNILNPDLLKELHYRLENLDCDYIYQIGELEQLIEDSTYSLFPQMLTTERPDKASDSIIEGKIVLLLQGSPFALVLPVTATEFMTTVEDKYVRFPFAIFMKAIRMIGILSSFLLSGLYIAIVNFHQEMIPPGLLLSLESAREAVPFSALFELLLMEISFDIIREASIRVPSPIGSTLGIIGGLIVGQAAVSANLVSPIAIIIVSLTGIGSFATPNYALNFSFRFLRYFYIFMGALGGFFGISTLMFVNCIILCNIKSLGVPLFSGLSSKTGDKTGGFLFQKPLYKKETRHGYLNPRLKRTQGKYARRWDK